jgi:peptidylamidoglycolate lyase
MLSKKACYLFVVLYVSLCGCSTAAHDGITNKDTTIRYELVKGWPQLPAGFVLGNPTGIGVDSAQNIIVFYRGTRTWPLLLPMPTSLIKENTIMVLNRHTGNILQSWGAGMFVMPHGLTVDKHNNIWVTDCGLQQVFKFNHEGVLLMKLGEAKVSGDDSLHFNRPTDVAIDDDGCFYISDGYKNSRIIKFSAEGKYLFEWGKKGDGPGEFNIPHSITLDEQGNVYVADRENNRVQVFDTTGTFLRAYRHDDIGKLYSVAYNKASGYLVSTDYITNYITPKGSNIILFDSTGNIATHFGRSGLYDGPVCRYHDIAVDDEGCIYVGDILHDKLQKFRRVR